MRYFLDTEFIDDGVTIDLISIAVVADDGRTFYAECIECDLSRASDWVKENVIPHLTGERRSREFIARALIDFMHGEPEIWAYYASYDFVALCQLYGRMMDLPVGWPKYIRDLKVLSESTGISLPRQLGTTHNALADALWVHNAWYVLHDQLTP